MFHEKRLSRYGLHLRFDLGSIDTSTTLNMFIESQNFASHVLLKPVTFKEELVYMIQLRKDK